MASSTNLPYPTLADSSNGPAAFQALAEALDSRTIVSVASEAARNDISAVHAPTPARPLFAYRSDLDLIQYTVNGSTWTNLAGGSGRHKVSPAGWTSELYVDREVTARGWKCTLFGQLIRTGGPIQPLTNAWFSITPAAFPTEYKPSNGFDIIAKGSIPGGDCDLLIGVTADTMAVRQPNAPSGTGIVNGDYLRFSGTTWFRDL